MKKKLAEGLEHFENVGIKPTQSWAARDAMEAGKREMDLHERSLTVVELRPPQASVG